MIVVLRRTLYATVKIIKCTHVCVRGLVTKKTAVLRSRAGSSTPLSACDSVNQGLRIGKLLLKLKQLQNV